MMISLGPVDHRLCCREISLAAKCGAGRTWRWGDQLGWVPCPSQLAPAASWRGGWGESMFCRNNLQNSFVVDAEFYTGLPVLSSVPVFFFFSEIATPFIIGKKEVCKLCC